MPTRVKLCYWLVVELIVVAQAQLHKQIAAMCMLQQLELDVCIVLSCAPMVYQAKQCATHAHCATPDYWTKACKLSSQRMLVDRMRQAANIQFALGWQLLVGSGRAQAAPRSSGRLAALADRQRPTVHHLTVHALQTKHEVPAFDSRMSACWKAGRWQMPKNTSAPSLLGTRAAGLPDRSLPQPAVCQPTITHLFGCGCRLLVSHVNKTEAAAHACRATKSQNLLEQQ